MNKILLNALQYEKNGAGISKYTHRLFETFIKEEYPIDVLIRGEFVDKYKGDNIISVNKDLSSSTKRIIEEQWCQKNIYKNYDVVHFPDYATPILFKKSKVATIHDMAMHTMKDKYTFMQNITKRTLLEATVVMASHLICDSEFTKKELLRYYPNIKAQLRVIPLGVDEPKEKLTDIEAHKIITKFGIRKPYIVCVGTLAPHKNITYLLKAFAEIKKKDKNHQLVIVGKKGWLYDEIFKTVQVLGLEQEVVFTGFVDEIQLEALYQCAQFYVSLSLYEGFGLPPLEAMIRGCPVLVSDLEIFRETCGDNVLFCNLDSMNDVVQQMKRLINDEVLRNQLKDLGIKRASQFRWHSTAQKTYEVYEEILKSEGEE